MPLKMEPDTSSSNPNLVDFIALTSLQPPMHPSQTLMTCAADSNGSSEDQAANFAISGSDLDLHFQQMAAVANDNSLEAIRNSDGDDMEDCKKPRNKRQLMTKIKQHRRRRSSSSSTNGGPIRGYNRKQISTEELAAQRNQANIRERARTQSLNEAFQNLRQSIPTLPSDKMSKIQTLKLASDYISFLYTVLQDGEREENCQMGNTGATSTVQGDTNAGDKNLSYYFNMWRMQDVWSNSSKDDQFINRQQHQSFTT